MSGNGSRERTKYYGTKGELLPTPRACDGLRAGGGNQTELMMTAERLWPTPRAGKVTDEDEGAWMARREKGDVSTPPLSLAVKLWATPSANEPGINPDLLVDKHGNPPSHVHQRLYNRETGKMAQDGLSQQVAIVDKASTSSPQATPVSPSPSPASAEARTMTAISGRRLLDSSLPSLPPNDPVACYLRTLVGTSAWASTRCYLTWNRSATPQSRPLYRLQVSTRPTAGIVSGLRAATLELERSRQQLPMPTDSQGCSEGVGLWPTPRVEGYDAGGHRGKADSLPAAVSEHAALWPTPHANCSTGSGSAGRDGGLNLQTAIAEDERMWWTPSAAVGKDDFVLSPAMADRYHAIHEGNLNEQVAATLWPAVGDSSSHDATTTVCFPLHEGGPCPSCGGSIGQEEQMSVAGDIYPSLACDACGWNESDLASPKRETFYPSPMAHEARLGYQDRRNGKKGTQESLTTVVINDEADAQGQDPKIVTQVRRLHSRWVARLMGLPDGWLEPQPAAALDPRWDGNPLNAFGPDWEDGMPRVVSSEEERVNKLKACGNGIVPQVAWVLLACMDEAGW